MKNTGILSLFLSVLAVAFAFPINAAESQHRFYVDSGYNYIDNSESSEGTWTTTLGYSFFFSPYLGFDLGYTDTLSNGASFQDGSGDNVDVKYRSYFAGARIEQPINNYSSFFARGGLGQTNLEETNVSFEPQTTEEHSGINPYIGIGAKMQPVFAEKLELSVELKYQDLEKDYSAASFTVGARFSL